MPLSHTHAPEDKIHVVHATAPTCWWSWGYEAVFNRLALVYGDQVAVHVANLCVYEDWNEYKKHYELADFGEFLSWAKEAEEMMGVPMKVDFTESGMPASCMPATLATLAAYRQGHEKGKRFAREMLRRFVVEGVDVTRDKVLQDAAAVAGLDATRFQRDMKDEGGLRGDLERQGEGAPPLHVGFYNIGITDGHGRTVTLDHQFEPSVVEEAIDFLARGKLKKSEPTDIASYLRQHGLTPLV